MTTVGTFSWRDYSNELSRTKLYFDNIDAGGANYDAVVAAMVNVQNAIEAITLLLDAGYGYSDTIGADPGTIPSNKEAQRESVLRVFFTDALGFKGSFTIPGPDKSLLTVQQGSDEVLLADAGVMQDLVDAVEGGAQSKFGQAITVTRAVLTGRAS